MVLQVSSDDFNNWTVRYGKKTTWDIQWEHHRNIGITALFQVSELLSGTM